MAANATGCRSAACCKVVISLQRKDLNATRETRPARVAALPCADGSGPAADRWNVQPPQHLQQLRRILQRFQPHHPRLCAEPEDRSHRLSVSAASVEPATVELQLHGR